MAVPEVEVRFTFSPKNPAMGLLRSQLKMYSYLNVRETEMVV